MHETSMRHHQRTADPIHRKRADQPRRLRMPTGLSHRIGRDVRRKHRDRVEFRGGHKGGHNIEREKTQGQRE